MERQVIHLRHSYSVYEKRPKGTKNERSRFIYTDAPIICGTKPHVFVIRGADGKSPLDFKKLDDDDEESFLPRRKLHKPQVLNL
jgi:hypothetical protein